MRFLRNDGGCLVKGLLLLVVACALLAPPAVSARDWRAGFGALVQAQAQGKPMQQNNAGRFQRREQERRAQQDRHNQGRLTQEERRALHKDLDRANREIYRR
jgi:hypothetical protein